MRSQNTGEGFRLPLSHLGPTVPRRHERGGGLSRGGRSELSEERSRAERRGEASSMRCGA